MAKHVDPFALTPTSAIKKTVNHFAGLYGTPQTDQQIQARAQAMIDPLIAAITNKAQTQAQASGANIKGLTDSYASELGKLNLQSPYQSATLQQASVDDALNQTLSGAGSDLASQLRSRLSAIQSDPAVAQTAAGLEGMGSAAGGTQVALGSNALSSLLAQGAAAGTYGASLPGIARLAGIQNIGRVNQQAQTDIDTETQQLLSQLPSLVQAIRSDNNSVRSNRASAAADLYTTLTGQNVTKATAKAGLGQNAIDNSFKFADTYGFNPKTGAKTTAAVKAAADAAAPDTSQSNSRGYVVDSSGNAILKGGKKQLLPGYTTDKKGNVVKTSTSKAGGITPNHLADMKKSAAKDSEDLYHGKTDAKGAVTAYTQTYQDALKTLAGRYPNLPKTYLKQLLDQWYQPGEFGKPKYSGPKPTKKQQAATSAALNPVATLIGGR